MTQQIYLGNGELERMKDILETVNPKKIFLVTGKSSYAASGAREIIEKASEKELTSGKSPSGVAAATMYMAAILCDERRTQAEIANISGVTEVTIRNNYKVLASELNIRIII